MRYWKCIGNEFNKYFTIDKIYSTDDNGHDIKDDKNGKYQTQVTEMCSAKFIEVKEEGENKMEDLRGLLKQGYVVVHIDDTLSKVEMNSEGKLVISGDDHWCLVDKLTKELYGYNGDTKVAIKEIYGYSDYNSHAHKVSLDGRELIWKRTEISPTQLKLEELEKKQREIADEMEKLRKEL